MGSWTDPISGSAIPLSSNRAVVASISTNCELSLKGESGFFLASSRTNLAAAVFPTPGGPYIITCWGLGPHNAARRASIPSSCPITSSKLEGRVKLDSGSVRVKFLIFFSLSFSLWDSLTTAFLLPCWFCSIFQKYSPMTMAKNNWITATTPLKPPKGSVILSTLSTRLW